MLKLRWEADVRVRMRRQCSRVGSRFPRRVRRLFLRTKLICLQFFFFFNFYFLNYYFVFSAQLEGSQFPDQGLNPGHGSGSPES